MTVCSGHRSKFTIIPVGASGPARSSSPATTEPTRTATTTTTRIDSPCIRPSLPARRQRTEGGGPITIRRPLVLLTTHTSPHVLDHFRRELAALHLLRAGHEAFEVVCDGLGVDRLFQALHDQVGDLLPAHVLEH